MYAILTATWSVCSENRNDAGSLSYLASVTYAGAVLIRLLDVLLIHVTHGKLARSLTLTSKEAKKEWRAKHILTPNFMTRHVSKVLQDFCVWYKHERNVKMKGKLSVPIYAMSWRYLVQGRWYSKYHTDV